MMGLTQKEQLTPIFIVMKEHVAQCKGVNHLCVSNSFGTAVKLYTDEDFMRL